MSRGQALSLARRSDVLLAGRDVPKLAKNPPPPSKAGDVPNARYVQLRSFAFRRDAWKGYTHAMTKGERAHGQGTTGQGGEDRTWEFCLRD